MNDFKEKILEGITSGEITAESKWRFLAHDYFFWFLAAVATVLGAVSVSSILHRIAQDQAPLAPYLRDFETVSVFVQTLPYVWFGIFVIFGAAAWFNFKKTSGSYKHQPIVFLSALVVALALGVALFAMGVGSMVDQEVRNRVPVFERQKMKRDFIRENYLKERGIKRGGNKKQQRPYPVSPPPRIR